MSTLRTSYAVTIVSLLALGCGDDDSMMMAGDSGMTDPDGGMGTDAGDVDSGPIATPTDCDRYCDVVTASCSGANAQFPSRADCVSYCNEAGWPLGTEGAMSGNSIECRIYHAGVAAGDPATHCPHSGATGDGVCGSVDFRTDAAGDYTRVDRMGMPAVSTALVSSAMKNAYNDADPEDDAALTFAGDLIANLTAIHAALDDDLVGAGLTPCSMTEMVSGLPECLGQEVAPGVTVASLVLPDTLHIDPSGAPGFPNGRALADPVIDVTLAVILLELGSGTCGGAPCSAVTLAGLPLNPAQNDVAGGDFLDAFPYLQPAHTP